MHMLGSLLPPDGERPNFSQLYIYDTENEVSNRVKNLRLKLIRKHNSDARTYNLPTASEVAALIVGDIDLSTGERDIIVENRSGVLQHIDELHPLYLPMQYLLLFPYGEDGYRPDMLYRDGSINQDHKYDAMTICATTEFPDLFITFTCNPKWPELDRLLNQLGCKTEDPPDLVSRIFKIKLNKLVRDITKDMLFGKCRVDIHTIEFQKRGLPHAHILIWLAAEDKLTIASQINSVIFAEIPNRNAHPELYEAVKNYMIHGPCGQLRKSSPCMVNAKCSKHFPKKFNEQTSFDDAGYCKYRRRDTGNIVVKNGVDLGIDSSKGPDRVIAKISNESNSHVDDTGYEIKQYYGCREPAVERLPFHLPNQQGIIFASDDNIDEVVLKASMKETKFLAWFEANKHYLAARELTYAQMPTMFVFKVESRQWCIRKADHSIGRLYYVPPGRGELHYLRVLLTFVKDPTCFEDIRTLNGVLYPTYKATCYAMGLLDDDKEYVDGITEANDILLKERHKTSNTDLKLDDDRIKEITLAEIEKILRSNRRSLRDYTPMPIPSDESMSTTENVLLSEELNYDRVLLKSEHATLLASLTLEQIKICSVIIDAVDRSEGGIFFVNGFGGFGKTFIWNTLTSAIRGRGQVVLAVASSGIASQLIPGGRTAHSRFAIPLNCNENSTCNIVQGSDLANLLIYRKLIIWDEAPMAHRFCFEALDRSLRDIIGNHNNACYNKPLGGKVVVFGGDFRQILPVIPIGSREDIVMTSLNSSYLWDSCKVLTLTKNMRLRTGNTKYENNEIHQFADWILNIGDGLIGDEINDEEKEITIPKDILITNVQNPVEAIVQHTYLLFLTNFENHEYIREREILAPTLEDGQVFHIIN
ncbi:hypothetical protein G2W53_014007 [Senna tora]|uniref:ATP-dependent DNA helicase n=1 Tax=Senna tora TaxID=362788 RepID=A0A834U4W8_9FABA|nr:hypothetical protein G2W53_014007 [Senna tora]